MSDDILTRLKSALAGRYDVRRELARGGMGKVFEARDQKHGRSVAIKVLAPALAAAIGPSRFQSEIETAARLSHPHIVPLFDSGEADGLLYYVMPLLTGESLRQRLLRERQLPLEDTVRIARDISDALHYAHEQGLVHRDVKPENIVFTGGHALILDFGIARSADAVPSAETHSLAKALAKAPADRYPSMAAFGDAITSSVTPPGRGTPGGQAPGRVMIAVLPLENRSADPEQEYFTDGMTEELIAQLGKLQPKRLGVIART